MVTTSIKQALIACCILILSGLAGYGQTPSLRTLDQRILLTNLSGFTGPGSNWQLVSNAHADLNKVNMLVTVQGTGVLVNMPPKKMLAQQDAARYNLSTALQHGDVDLELDFMLAKEAGSGVYLQGRYEIQLFDSWNVRTPHNSDNGAISQRWDDNRTDEQKGYEGHAPRQNASRAPGLWQHLKISFQAPRFSSGATSQKMENARLLRVELNGVLVQEDVELTGPTRGSLFTDEKPTGPLVLEGGQGAVAFRNISYVAFNKPRPELLNLKYAVYKGKYEKEMDFNGKAPESEGPTARLSASVSTIPNEFLIRYTGTLRVSEPGEYRINLGLPGGGGVLKINNQPVGQGSRRGNNSRITLPQGDLPFELLYSKFVDWAKPAIGLAISGPGIREYALSDGVGSDGNDVDPIIVNAPTNTLLRSFMDVPAESGVSLPSQLSTPGKSMRVTHAISVGSPDGVHYTYDLDKGALVQVWRGLFLDATPMWHNRGDGSSRPTGMVQRMGIPMLFLARLPDIRGNWLADTTGSGYRPKGYVLDEIDRPTFRYQTYGMSVDDKIRVINNGLGIQREVTLSNLTKDVYARLASGHKISVLENGMYLIDEQEYIRLDDLGGAQPTIRDSAGGQELIIPVKGKLTYSILF